MKPTKPVALVASRSADIPIYCSHQMLLDPKGLMPHPDNNNNHSDEQVEMMQKMILASGWRSVVVLSQRTNRIVAGHLRVRAAIAMGMLNVPVDIQYFATRAAEFKHLTADNELAKLSEFDPEKWAQTAHELESEMSSDEFSEFIFNSHEFGLEEIPDEFDNGDDDEEEKEAPLPVVEKPITLPGDVWILGKHKLMCADSAVRSNIDHLMSGEKADMVFTDPPYRMQAEGGSNQLVGKNARKLGEKIKHLCDFEPALFLKQLPSVFDKKIMNAYIFCNKDLVPDYLNWGLENGYSFNILFWKKPNAIPLGGSHRPDVEYLLLFRKGAIWNNGVKGVNYSKCLEFGRENSTAHPTMKPVGLITNEILISSNEGGIVFEFFSGSGSTIVAAEKTGRRCFAMEIDPTYTDIAVQRWQNLTGLQATLEGDGRSYEEITSERLK